MQGGTASPNREFWNGRRVLVVGNTGFKGSWLSLWLHRLGAESDRPVAPAAHRAQPVRARRSVGSGADDPDDIRDLDAVRAAMETLRPELVFHLAAQALVRASYREPVETYATNVMGTVHVLEAVRRVPTVRSVVVVTSDKCYENREWPWAYRETEAMGGHDPYSSSKGCAELVTAAYRRSFFSGDRAVGVATVRAGNVIGGGDWAEDRLLPDCIKALGAGKPIAIRSPRAVRPWQHVLEPLCGYLMLAERLDADPGGFGDAWNFGPADHEARPVAWIASRVVEQWGDDATWFSASGADAPHESATLKVDAVAGPRAAGLGAAAADRRGAGLDGRMASSGSLPGEPALALTDRQIARYCELATMTASTCRFCRAELRRSFVDLGRSPLSNALLTAEQLPLMEPHYPLHAYVCENCLLVQLEAFATPDTIFTNYPYFSSFSETWLRHCGSLCGADDARSSGSVRIHWSWNWRATTATCCSISASAGSACLASSRPPMSPRSREARGVPTEVAFFGAATAHRLAAAGRQADLICANNVLAHVPDLNDFVAGLPILLKPSGTITVEFPHLLRLIAERQFDTIYHEHFSYFSLLVVDKVFARHGLRVFDVDRLPTHGGSLRIHACHAADTSRHAPATGLPRVIAEETYSGAGRSRDL